MQHLFETPIAHRGLHAEGMPENSIAAFEAAVERGFAVECDVHLTTDWQLAVFHDVDLERMTGKAGDIRRLHSDDLCHLPLSGTEQYIPLLGDVLDVLGGRVPVFVEIKSEGIVQGGQGRLEAVLANHLRDYKGLAAVLSFDPFALECFSKLAPEVPRGQLVEDNETLNPEMRKALRELAFLSHSRPHCIASRLDLLESPAVERQRVQGVPIIGWTATSQAEFDRASRLCDAVVFEGFVLQR